MFLFPMKSMPSTKLSLISLEAREVPTAGIWSTETFDHSNQLPSGWSGSGPAFQIMAHAGITGHSLSTHFSSRDTSLIWQNQPYSADTSVRVHILANSSVPIQLIARGQNLGTNQASYYGVQITAGLQIELFKMVNGVRNSLATLTSLDPISGIWLEVTLVPQGSNLKVQVKRLDNHQFLNSSGAWQSTESYAISRQDHTISHEGHVGLLRVARTSGRVDLDNFSTLVPLVDSHEQQEISQTFDTLAINTLPNSWSSWGSDGVSGFGAAAPRSRWDLPYMASPMPLFFGTTLNALFQKVCAATW